MIPDTVLRRRTARWLSIKGTLLLVLLGFSLLALIVSMVMLALAGSAAPWYGWCLDVGLAAMLAGLVMQRRRIRLARYAFAVAIGLIVVSCIGAVGAVNARGLWRPGSRVMERVEVKEL